MGEPFDGDLLFFTATAGKDAASPRPEDWRPHFSGRLEIHDIACAHGAMTRPEPIAHIGRVLAEKLR
jgi:thioesterase domain-containing protein